MCIPIPFPTPDGSKGDLSTVGLSALAKLLDFSGNHFCDLHYQILLAILWIHTGISYPSLVKLDRVIEKNLANKIGTELVSSILS